MTSPTQSAMEQQQREELLPCPFCGDVAPELNHREHNKLFYAECTSCMAQVFDREASRAIAAWNRRDSSELRSLRDSLALARSRIAELEGPGVKLAGPDAAPEQVMDVLADMHARAALNKEQP